MEEDGDEPHDVAEGDPELAEGKVQQHVRILSLTAGELGKLHLGPEMRQVEEKESQDDNTQHQHVLGRPGICGGFAGNLVPIVTTAGADVLPGQVAAVGDMDNEAQGQDRDHDGYDGEGHEVAAHFEQAVFCSVSAFE